MDPHSYLDALMEAASHGDQKKPYVSVSILRFPIPAIRFMTQHEGFVAQRIVSWADFLASREPAAVLLAAVDNVRKAALSAVIP
jgi:hypothetical protein